MPDQQPPRFNVIATFSDNPDFPPNAVRRVTITTEPTSEVFLRWDLPPIGALRLAARLLQGTDDVIALASDTSDLPKPTALIEQLAAVWEAAEQLQAAVLDEHDRQEPGEEQESQAVWDRALIEARSNAEKRPRIAAVPHTEPYM